MSSPPSVTTPGRAILALLLGLLALAAALPAAADALRIDRVIAADGSGPPFPAGALRVVTLPDDWSRSRPGSGEPVWYRTTFDAATAGGAGTPLALQVAHVCSTLAVWINGHLVGEVGHLGEPYGSSCGRPQLVVLPPALVQQGANRLELRVAGPTIDRVASRHRAAGLSALEIGPLAVMQARQHRRELLQVQLPQALGAALLLTGGFMFVLGFIHRRDSHLAYFGVLSVAWALTDATSWLHAWPLPAGTAEPLLAAMPALVTHAAVQFLLRHGQWRHRLVDRLLPAQTVLMPSSLAVALAADASLHAVVMAWTGLFAIEVLAAAAFYLQRQWRDGSLSRWPMGVLLGVTAASGAVEAAAQWQGTPGVAVILARLITPITLVLVGLWLVREHGRARQVAEAGKAQLEQRVREAAAEIERNYRQLAELRIEQVTERERKRIAADLHDDLGAKLLTIVHTSESDRISTLAREALEEMRLSVRGLTGRPVKLADALGDWRAEFVSRLAQAGIEAEWSAPEDLPQTLSARAYVQTTRILREATSNIIKHSGASLCSVNCQVADGDFQLVVQDNGEGITSEPDGRIDRGHGMATMKHRAKQLQGQCLVESGPGFGTVIRLTLPLDRALEAA